MIIVSLIKARSFSRATLASSTRLHNQVFRSVLTCPMSFFDTTPTGRILNRFVSVLRKNVYVVSVNKLAKTLLFAYSNIFYILNERFRFTHLSSRVHHLPLFLYSYFPSICYVHSLKKLATKYFQ